MTTVQITDGAGATKYLKATSAGTSGDPYVVHHNIDTIAAGTNAIGKLAANSGVDIGDVDILSIAAGDNNIGNVDIASALPAGTNAIGKLAANSGVDIGDVDILSIAAGENVIGKVLGGGVSITQTPTITVGAYSAKDAVGGKLTFAGAARVSGGVGRVDSVTIIDLGDVKADLELWLFDRDFTANDDNAAFDPSDADLANCIGVIPIAAANYYSAADNGVGCVRAVGLTYKSNATAIYGQLKCVGTPTYADTGGLKVILAVEYVN